MIRMIWKRDSLLYLSNDIFSIKDILNNLK